jgi:hypothetical protein
MPRQKTQANLSIKLLCFILLVLWVLRWVSSSVGMKVQEASGITVETFEEASCASR